MSRSQYDTTCLVLMRDSSRPDAGRIPDDGDAFFRDVVEPAAADSGLTCLRLDPRQFGINDETLFRMLERCPLVVVDAAAESMDYAYSLGVRHALSDAPTLILIDEHALPFDVGFPRGVVPLSRGNVFSARDELAEVMRDALSEVRDRFSPVRAALENVPRVFLSYAHEDREAVAAVDQWLRDESFRVDFDERDFVAGRDIRDEIVRFVQRAGKVVCFYSAASHDRYYPKLERRLAEEAERRGHSGDASHVVLLYFRLDDTSLPLEYEHRLAVNAWTMSFTGACRELVRHLTERPAAPGRVDLSEYRTNAPW